MSDKKIKEMKIIHEDLSEEIIPFSVDITNIDFDDNITLLEKIQSLEQRIEKLEQEVKG